MLVLLSLAVLGLACTYLFWLLFNYADARWNSFRGQLNQDARNTLDAAFLFVELAHLRPLAFWVAGFTMLIAAWLVGRWWGILPVLLMLFFLPGFILRNMRRRRARRFDAQLPDLLQALAGALRAGSGVQPALQHIVAQSQPPLAQEFALLLRQQRLGMSFYEALSQLRERMPSAACALVVSALTVAGRTGGNLADILENISVTLRAREHWLGRVQALTAQGRLQSNVMTALPILLVMVLAQLDPDTMALLWQTWPGWLLMLAMLVLELCGYLWIRRIIAIDV